MRTKKDPLAQEGPKEPTAEEQEHMPQSLHTEEQNTGSGTVQGKVIGMKVIS